MSTRNVVILVAAVVVGLGVVAVALCGGFFYFGFKSTNEKLSPLVDKLFAAIDQGKIVDVYDTDTTPEFRKVMTREQFDQAGKTIAERLGHLRSKSLKRFKMHTSDSHSYLEGTYEASFEKGAAEILLNIRDEGGQPKIAGFFVKSPALAAAKPKPVAEPKPGEESKSGDENKPDGEAKPDANSQPDDRPKVEAPDVKPAEEPAS